MQWQSHQFSPSFTRVDPNKQNDDFSNSFPRSKRTKESLRCGRQLKQSRIKECKKSLFFYTLGRIVRIQNFDVNRLCFLNKIWRKSVNKSQGDNGDDGN